MWLREGAHMGVKDWNLTSIVSNNMFCFFFSLCHWYSALEEETILARQERDALNQQLLNTIKHKVALSQEVESWQVGVVLIHSETKMFRSNWLKSSYKSFKFKAKVKYYVYINSFSRCLTFIQSNFLQIVVLFLDFTFVIV